MCGVTALIQFRASMQSDPRREFVHFFPSYGPKAHVCGAPGTPCWCNPTIDEVDGRIVVHYPSH